MSDWLAENWPRLVGAVLFVVLVVVTTGWGLGARPLLHFLGL